MLLVLLENITGQQAIVNRLGSSVKGDFIGRVRLPRHMRQESGTEAVRLPATNDKPPNPQPFLCIPRCFAGKEIQGKRKKLSFGRKGSYAFPRREHDGQLQRRNVMLPFNGYSAPCRRVAAGGVGREFQLQFETAVVIAQESGVSLSVPFVRRKEFQRHFGTCRHEPERETPRLSSFKPSEIYFAFGLDIHGGGGRAGNG